MATIIVGRKPEVEWHTVTHRYSALELATTQYTSDFIRDLQDQMIKVDNIPKAATFITQQDDSNINFYKLVAEWWEIEIPD